MFKELKKMLVLILSLKISIKVISDITISIPFLLNSDFEFANKISSVSRVGIIIEILFFKQISNKSLT